MNAGPFALLAADRRASLCECPDCGRLLSLEPPSLAGLDACCPRCGSLVQRADRHGLDAALALAAAASIFYVATVASHFLTLRLFGQPRTSHVASGAYGFAEDGFWSVSLILLLTLVAAPFLRLALRVVVLGGLRLAEPPRWLHLLFRWHQKLGPWAMLEVFLFGALISYTRLVDLAAVEVGPAAYGLGLLVLTLAAADVALAPQAVWQALERRGSVANPGLDGRGLRQTITYAGDDKEKPIACTCCGLVHAARPGQPCLRCGQPLHRRKPQSMSRAWALIAAAAILYLPANYFPVMEIITLGKGGPHTILGGVVEFVETGFWPLALIVFLASIAIPMLKLVGLAAMLIAIHRRSAAKLVQRTRLYRFIEVIGRWSMIDVFVVAVLVALVRFGTLANITAEVGAACFAGVVILTMLAADAFDPRLMWDAAGEQRGPAA